MKLAFLEGESPTLTVQTIFKDYHKNAFNKV